MQALAGVFQLAKDIGSNSKARLRAVSQSMIDALLLPLGDKMGRLRLCSRCPPRACLHEYQISCLVGELEQELKTAAESEDGSPKSTEHEFGTERKNVALHYRYRGTALIEDALANCKKRELYARVMGEPNRGAHRCHHALDAHGRGKKRTRWANLRFVHLQIPDGCSLTFQSHFRCSSCRSNMF